MGLWASYWASEKTQSVRVCDPELAPMLVTWKSMSTGKFKASSAPVDWMLTGWN